jgi:hypothetical protein
MSRTTVEAFSAEKVQQYPQTNPLLSTITKMHKMVQHSNESFNNNNQYCLIFVVHNADCPLTYDLPNYYRVNEPSTPTIGVDVSNL